MRISFSRDKHFEPILRTHLLGVLLEEATSLGLHGYLFCAVVARVVQEGYWLSESDEERHLSVILLTLDIAHSLTDIVQVLRRFDDVFNEIWSFQQIVSAPLLPNN